MAWGFNNANDEYLTLGSNLGLALPFSVSVWFKPTPSLPSVNSGVVSVGVNAANNNYYALTVQSDGKVRAQQDSVFARTSTTMTADVWGHLAGSFNTTTDRAVWLNGGGKGTDATSNAERATSAVLVGAFFPTTGLLDITGHIAELAFYSEAMTDAEAALLANGVHPARIKPGKLVEYFSLVRELTGLRGKLLVVQSGSPAAVAHLTGLSGLNRYPRAFSFVPQAAAPAALTQTNIIGIPSVIDTGITDSDDLNSPNALSQPELVGDGTSANSLMTAQALSQPVVSGDGTVIDNVAHTHTISVPVAITDGTSANNLFQAQELGETTAEKDTDFVPDDLIHVQSVTSPGLEADGTAVNDLLNDQALEEPTVIPHGTIVFDLNHVHEVGTAVASGESTTINDLEHENILTIPDVERLMQVNPNSIANENGIETPIVTYHGTSANNIIMAHQLASVVAVVVTDGPYQWAGWDSWRPGVDPNVRAQRGPVYDPEEPYIRNDLISPLNRPLRF